MSTTLPLSASSVSGGELNSAGGYQGDSSGATVAGGYYDYSNASDATILGGDDEVLNQSGGYSEAGATQFAP